MADDDIKKEYIINHGDELNEGVPSSKKKKIIGGIIAIILIALIVYMINPFSSSHISKPPITSNTIPTNKIINTTKIGYLSSCANISAPGIYNLSNMVSPFSNKACISVLADNVKLNCGGATISGYGAYTDKPPFNYGIKIVSKNNVTIENCKIANFSYNIYSENSGNIKLTNDTLINGYVNNLYLNGTYSSTVDHSYFINSTSPFGAVAILNNSQNNKFTNNTFKNNLMLGFNISSSNNKFINNYITGSKESFMCSIESGFPNNNTAIGNRCYNNDGCDFVSCNGTNIPHNVSAVTLQKNIASCGSIIYPGSYYISQNLNMENFSTFSRNTLAQYNTACINIKAANVTLNCLNHAISNAYIGIKDLANNTEISNCNVQNSNYGIVLNSGSSSKIHNIILNNNGYGLYLNNTDSLKASNISTDNNKYGILLKNAYSNVFLNFTSNNNAYGLYLSSSEGNLFNKGSALHNTKADVYATLDSIGASNDLMSSTSCYLTDAQWAPCTLHSSPVLTSYPIDKCMDIITPGNYNLSSSILYAKPSCFTIDTNNVTLNCSNFNITANPGTAGPAIVINNKSNVTVSDCRILNYQSAIIVNNSKNITLSNILGKNINNFGIKASNLTSSVINNVNISTTNNFTISLTNVDNSKILNNIFKYGSSKNYGLILNNSSNDIVSGNKGDSDYVGIALLGSSLNDTLMNNTFSNNNEDYVCGNNNSALNDGNSYINYGNKKVGCHWLIVEPSTVSTLSECFAETQPSFISLSHDELYTTGATCFTLLANGTTFNCNGHTIEATNGGTLVELAGNNRYTKFENCYIKGFTTPIKLINDNGGEIYNNTILGPSNSSNSNNSTIITAINSINVEIKNNTITTPFKGVYIKNETYGELFNNTVNNAEVAFSLDNVTAMQIWSNNATKTNGVGTVITNTIQSSFSNNRFYGIAIGFACFNSTINTDMGNNYCSSNIKCTFISSSSSTCK
ncbi:MAG: right-handed parallel beta-helix repeat-containing protein [Candidatus Micrarchaeia archaeon]